MLKNMESNKPLIQIVLADKHNIVRNGIRHEIEAQADMRIVGETGNGYELLDISAAKKPDIIILDNKLAGINGVKVTRCLTSLRTAVGQSEYYQPPAVLVYTAYDNKQYIWSLLAAGAKGYLLKSDPIEQLFKAIRQLALGNTFLSHSVQTKIVEAVPTLHQELSEGEIKILQLMARGYTNEEIAQNLHISEGTVRSHLNHTYRKVPWIRSRAEAIAWAWINRVVTDIE